MQVASAPKASRSFSSILPFDLEASSIAQVAGQRPGGIEEDTHLRREISRPPKGTPSPPIYTYIHLYYSLSDTNPLTRLLEAPATPEELSNLGAARSRRGKAFRGWHQPSIVPR